MGDPVNGTQAKRERAPKRIGGLSSTGCRELWGRGGFPWNTGIQGDPELRR